MSRQFQGLKEQGFESDEGKILGTFYNPQYAAKFAKTTLKLPADSIGGELRRIRLAPIREYMRSCNLPGSLSC